MSSAFDVPKAVDKRLSTMAVDELAKRGMRTVKVLDKASIMSLIDEAVETGFEARSIRPMEFGGDMGTNAVTEEVMRRVRGSG